MTVSFDALIKKLEIKSLVSGDKGATLTLMIDNPPDELIDGLNKLHRADRFVSVGIAGKDNDQ